MPRRGARGRLIREDAFASRIICWLRPATAAASSLALATPFEPSCVLVFGPGRYRFRDFYVVGLPLSIVLLVAARFLLPVFWLLRTN